MSDIQKIIQKIKALRARAADDASTEAEAEIAMRVANDLMAKHNVTVSEIDVRADGVTKQTWNAGGSQMPVERFSFFGIEKLCNVKLWLTGSTVSVLGAPADTELALYFIDIVRAALDAGYAQYQKGWDFYRLNKEQGLHGRSIRANFKKGVAIRLGRRMAQMASEQAPVATGTGIVLVKNALINQWLADKGMKFAKAGGSNLTNRDAFEAGKSYADKVGLNRGIAGQRSTLALA